MLCTVLLVVLTTVGSVHSESSCPACSCQFDGIQLLTGLVEGIVNDTLFTNTELLDNIVKSLHYQFGKLSMFIVHVFTGRSYAFGVAIWTPVDVTLIGSVYIDTASPFHFQIPDIIPHTASEFFLYAVLVCGAAGVSKTNDILFYVEHDGVQFKKYVYMRSHHQSGFNTNSDNMWFPMPADRRIHMIVPVPVPQNCFAQLHTIGYR